MISFFKNKIQNRINKLGELRNGSVSCNNLSQFTQESIRKGPLSDFVYKEKYGTPLEKSHFQLNLKEGLENEISRKYFIQFLQFKGYITLLKIMKGLEAYRIDNSNTSQPCSIMNGEGSGESQDSECDILDLWNLCLEEETKNRLQIPESLHKSWKETGYNSELIDMLYQNVEQILDGQWAEFSKSECYCKYQVEILTSDHLSLADILCHPTGMSYFMEYLEEENCQNVLEFWLAVTNFERLLSECSLNTPQESQEDAILIYDKYLSLQALSPLGCSDKVRFDTELSICEETGVNPHCFQPACSVVLAFLRYQLDQFTSSQHFDRLLSEIISTCRKASPCSSMSSISTECIGGGEAKCVTSSNHVRGLSFGRIDQLGRFETDVHPEPNRKESAISKVMKKLTTKDKEVEEELAWKVAEKIVKNVTTLTMGDGDVDSDDDL